MTKPGDTTDTDKYIYSGYGLAFDSTGQFSHPQGGRARNIIFGVDLSNSVHATNKTQNILILGHGLIQKVNKATIYAEKMYSSKLLTKPGDTTDTDKYIYSGYGLAFDSTGQFSHPQGGRARNIIFGVDLSNSVHATNKTQNILILGHGLIQKVNKATIYAEKMYSSKLRVENKIFCLSLHYNDDNIYLLMVKKSLNLKPKNLKLKQTN